MNFLKGVPAPAEQGASFGFVNFKRRLQETALDKLGVKEVICDKTTNDALINGDLEKVHDSKKYLEQTKRLLLSHIQTTLAYKESLRAISLASLYSPGDGVAVELPSRFDDKVFKCFEHCLKDNCVELINHSLELTKIITEKQKRRHNMVLDYSHHHRLHQRIMEKEEAEPEEIARRKAKLAAATESVTKANTELSKILKGYIDLWPSVEKHVKLGLTAAHGFLSSQICGSAAIVESSSSPNPLQADLTSILLGLRTGKTLRVFSSRYTALQAQIIGIVQAPKIPFASEVVATNSSRNIRSSSFEPGGQTPSTLTNEIPGIIIDCITYISAHGLDHVGVFRLAGDSTEVDDLLELYVSAEESDEADATHPLVSSELSTVNNVCSLMKLYLRNLPVSLIPPQSYTALLKSLESAERLTTSLLSLSKSWPEGHWTLLETLIQFLRKIEAKSLINMMTSQNLAIVFAPTILKPEKGYDPMLEMKDVNDVIKVVEFIIDSDLFRDESDDDDNHDYNDNDSDSGGKRVASYIKKKKKESVGNIKPPAVPPPAVPPPAIPPPVAPRLVSESE
ncbi:hypothetical protein TrVE_jg13903 [Triparma verrucosa]|uniref:Rho-GAP domain-containing protein n=1 Tax=Triparma verrucosa TaxID=1606542 RepID=A0A9W7B3G9_9STRA|nr:hypothetical protein TrVE_jg13903 [Triparma verrucosa]